MSLNIQKKIMPDTKLILLIDDHKAIRDALLWILEEEGYSVITAANGKIALALLETDPLPSLIILDMMMPIMDGLQFTAEQKLNPRLINIPVIITSAKNNLEKHFQPSPYTILLPKPFDIDNLLKIVGDYCNEKVISR